MMLVSLCNATNAAWTLNTNVPVSNIVSILQINVENRECMFITTNSEHHLLLFYHTPSGSGPAEIVDANLTQGTIRKTNMPSGTVGVHATVYYPSNGLIYVANNADKLFEYDPVTGSSNKSIALTDYGGNLQIGDDGFIYIGIGGGKADRYNPTSAVYQAIGLLDPSTPIADPFVTSLGADTNWLYATLGESPYYLAVYDTTTGSKTRYFDTDGDTYGAVYRGTNGGWFYRRGEIDPVQTTWWGLTNGIPIQMSNAPAVVQWSYRRGNVVDDAMYFASEFGWDVTMDGIFPDSSHNYISLGYKESINTNWSSLSVSNFSTLEDAPVDRLYFLRPGVLFGITGGYGPDFLFYASNHNVVSLGRTSVNGTSFSEYDAAISGTKIYLSGYTAATAVYDSSLPWSLTFSTTNRYATNLNPHHLEPNFGKYHYYIAVGADGLIYIAGEHQRDSTGGELGWIDPVTGTNGSIRDRFASQEPRDLQPALNATKMVYLDDGGSLLVLDIATKQIVLTNNTISPDGSYLDKCVEVAPGIMVGFTTNSVWKFDIENNVVLATNTLPGTFGKGMLNYDRRATLGPDGFVWATIDNDLYRIDHTTLNYELVKTNVGPHNLTFDGGSAYLSAADSTEIHEMKDLLIYTGSRILSENLRVTGSIQGR